MAFLYILITFIIGCIFGVLATLLFRPVIKNIRNRGSSRGGSNEA